MGIAVDYHTLTTTPNFPTSTFHLQGRTSARTVSVAGGNRAQDSMVRDTTSKLVSGVGFGVVDHLRQ
jgi:hypothetical protein